jgi:hypothetical protein
MPSRTVADSGTISGTSSSIGSGDRRPRTKSAPTGSFILIPGLTQHYVFAKGVTITQVHGIGPSGIAYVNPADDPRKVTTNTAPAPALIP